ncbi:MAG: hypothetical protein RLZZ536_1366 [Planctomycetota bacterium]|jgi:hypothetical protein
MNRLVVFFNDSDTEGSRREESGHTGTATVRELA